VEGLDATLELLEVACSLVVEAGFSAPLVLELAAGSLELELEAALFSLKSVTYQPEPLS
jgi:hypothetical protein